MYSSRKAYLRILFIPILLILCHQTNAQKYTINGTAVDTFYIKNVAWASVSLIQQKDSILKQFGRTDLKGNFSFGQVDSGDYFLLFAHQKYTDYVLPVSIRENKDFGNIVLTDRGKLLQEVVIRSVDAIQIKGDTLEYFADSFKVRQGANVEELLRQLPGLQVDANGAITAQGQKVDRVLVNGEEFFGEDPTIATQNLPSNIVNKVQVFDKKSEEEELTGFDDGQESTTINLQLKKGMNKGVFGKIKASGGLPDQWDNAAMINAFENKRQMSAYALMNNIGNTGLDWKDAEQYGGAQNSYVDEDGGFVTFINDDDDDENWQSQKQGLTKAWRVGGHYANKFNEGQHELNLNYSTRITNRDRWVRENTESVLPNDTIYKESYLTRNDRYVNHSLSFKYDWNIDSTLSLGISANGRIGSGVNESHNENQNENGSRSLMSQTMRTTKSKSQRNSLNGNINLQKKFAKKGRTIQGNLRYNTRDNQSSAFIDGFYAYGLTNNGKTDTLDQNRLNDNEANSSNLRITYTEPLSKKLTLKLSYGFSNSLSYQNRKTYIQKVFSSGNYNEEIDSLSNIFESVIRSHEGDISLKYELKNISFSLGNTVRTTHFIQEDQVRNRDYNYTRNNLLPNLNIRYKISKYFSFNLGYRGSTQNPSPNQLQPIVDNSNPLDLSIGNPNLKMQYNQRISMGFNRSEPLAGRWVYANVWYSNQLNPISLNRIYNETGQTINQYVNLKSSNSIGGWIGGGTKIKTSLWYLGMQLSPYYTSRPNIINGIEGKTNNISMDFGPNIRYSNSDLLFFHLNLNVNYNNNQNQLLQDRNISYFEWNPEMAISFVFPKFWEASTNISYTYQPAVAPYNTSFSRALWNAGITKRVLPKRNLELNFRVQDLLNQNKGYNRSTSANYNTETSYNNLARYWMISAVWNFFSGPKAVSQSGFSKEESGKGWKKIFHKKKDQDTDTPLSEEGK